MQPERISSAMATLLATLTSSPCDPIWSEGLERILMELPTLEDVLGYRQCGGRQAGLETY